MKENILVTGLVREQYEKEYTSNSLLTFQSNLNIVSHITLQIYMLYEFIITIIASVETFSHKFL